MEENVNNDTPSYVIKKGKRQRGANRREKCTVRFKAKITHKCTPGASLYEIVEKYYINQSLVCLVSKWLKNKDKIIHDLVIANRKFLNKT